MSYEEDKAIAKEYIDDALRCVAYLHATGHLEENNPFGVEFYWHEDGFGSMAKLDLREDLLEAFQDDPEHYKDKIALCAKAFRDFANELDHMLEKVEESQE